MKNISNSDVDDIPAQHAQMTSLHEVNENTHENNRRIRSNAQDHFQRKINNIIYTFNIVIVIAFLIADITVLVLNWNKSCDSPLKLWLILKIGLQFIDLFHISNNKSTTEELNNETITEEDNCNEKLSKMTTPCLLCLNTVLLVLAIIWLFSSNNCHNKLPQVYDLVLVHIISGLIFNVCTCLCCCILICTLPCMLHIIEFIPNIEGASKDEICQLNSYTFTSDGFAKDNTLPRKSEYEEFVAVDDECCVCLEPYQEKDQLRVLRCKHNFHKECCDKWLKLNRACPLCRRNPFLINSV